MVSSGCLFADKLEVHCTAERRVGAHRALFSLTLLRTVWPDVMGSAMKSWNIHLASRVRVSDDMICFQCWLHSQLFLNASIENVLLQVLIQKVWRVVESGAWSRCFMIRSSSGSQFISAGTELVSLSVTNVFQNKYFLFHRRFESYLPLLIRWSKDCEPTRSHNSFTAP